MLELHVYINIFITLGTTANVFVEHVFSLGLFPVDRASAEPICPGRDCNALSTVFGVAFS